jgi:hypothetical protein
MPLRDSEMYKELKLYGMKDWEIEGLQHLALKLKNVCIDLMKKKAK